MKPCTACGGAYRRRDKHGCVCFDDERRAVRLEWEAALVQAGDDIDDDIEHEDDELDLATLESSQVYVDYDEQHHDW